MIRILIYISMYNLIEYSNNSSKSSGSLWQCCKDIPAMNNNDNIVNFNGANATDSFNFKAKITRQTDDDGEMVNVEVNVPLKYLSNFWKTFPIPWLIGKLILFRLGLKIVLLCILMLQIKVLYLK